jgi:hypothetical protein
MDFPKKTPTSSLKSKVLKYEKSDAPTFNETSYHRDFGAMMPSPTTSAKRAEVKLMGGGKLSSDTTYNHNYRAKTEGYHPLNPIRQKEYSLSHAATVSS